MIILWDSSDMLCRLVLVKDDTRYEYEWRAERTLARDMLAFLRDRLAEHDASFNGVTAIGVFRGPGSFTGLRIGLTVLNTFANANHIPIVGAVGDDWQSDCLARLSRGDDDKVVLPEYGADAHITQPRK